MSKPLKDNICEERLFSSLFNKYSKDLNNFLFYKFGSTLSPSDKVQEAFVKLWENCGKITPDKAKSFLFTTANNLMLNAYAHQKVVRRHEQIKPKFSTNESPEFLLQEKEYQEKLNERIDNLEALKSTKLNNTEASKENTAFFAKSQA